MQPPHDEHPADQWQSPAGPPADDDIVVIEGKTPPDDMRSPAEPPARPDGRAGGAAPPEAEMPVSEPAGAARAPGTDQRWSEILAMFVDDPRASVRLAADLTGQGVEDLVVSVRQRQASLASAWQDGDAGTEALRGVLRDYRAFWTTLRDLPAAAETSARPRADAPGPERDVTGPERDVTSPHADGTFARPGTYPDAGAAADQNEPGRGRMPA